MAYALPTFAELYAVSDIHLGGTRTDAGNFQIFRQGARLAGFIDGIAAQRPDEDLALVLNGDIIDSLAETDLGGYVAMDEPSALKLIDRIWNDPAFNPVWLSLQRFLALPRRHLIVVVGNHDIELSLPVVEADLRQRLAGDDVERRSRLVFSTHGAGYACRVGAARVFCTHGNEVDAWNWVDYNRLGQLANAISAGRAGDPSLWKPNAGTRLVKDVMNTIKQAYPFVDLLKPEAAAIAAVAMVIDKDTFGRIDLRDLLPIALGKEEGTQVTDHLLSAPGPQAAATAEVPDTWLGPHLQAAIRERQGAVTSADDLLQQAEAAMTRGQRPSASLGAGSATETLGWKEVIAGRLGLLPKEEALRQALRDWVVGDSTYDVAAEDDDFRKIRDRIADTVDVTITGHTHLARALRLPDGRCYYNCGTWIRLLRLTPQALESQKDFADQVWPVLRARSMDALDEALIPGPSGPQRLLFDRTNAVRLSAQGAVTLGDLLRVTEDADGHVVWQPEPTAPQTRIG